MNQCAMFLLQITSEGVWLLAASSVIRYTITTPFMTGHHISMASRPVALSCQCPACDSRQSARPLPVQSPHIGAYAPGQDTEKQR